MTDIYMSSSAIDSKRLLVGPIPVSEGSEYALASVGAVIGLFKAFPYQ